MVRTVKLFVEGGGKSKTLHTECRRAFNAFLLKSGLEGHMPRIVACGSRNEAYNDYCKAIQIGEDAVLLVDSEAPVIVPQNITDELSTWKPWYHLKNRDNWDKPQIASEKDCHLMVELMESWFLADINTLRQYYGQGFNERSFPGQSIECISKNNVIQSLENATRATQKGAYSKGSHSFEILERIDSNKIISQSKWAQRFVTLLLEKMQ